MTFTILAENTDKAQGQHSAVTSPLVTGANAEVLDGLG